MGSHEAEAGKGSHLSTPPLLKARGPGHTEQNLVSKMFPPSKHPRPSTGFTQSRGPHTQALFLQAVPGACTSIPLKPFLVSPGTGVCLIENRLQCHLSPDAGPFWTCVGWL